MSDRLHRLVFRALVIAPVSVFIILGSWLFYVRTESQTISAAQQLRQSSMLLQRAEQQLQRLTEADTNPLARVAGEDIDSVQIRLAEFLRHYPVSDDVSVTAFEQSIHSESIPTAEVALDEGFMPQLIQILRVDIAVAVAHGPALLTLLSELKGSIKGWPVDVRACDIHKTPMQRLNARCVIDIYYWQLDAGE